MPYGSLADLGQMIMRAGAVQYPTAAPPLSQTVRLMSTRLGPAPAPAPAAPTPYAGVVVAKPTPQVAITVKPVERKTAYVPPPAPPPPAPMPPPSYYAPPPAAPPPSAPTGITYYPKYETPPAYYEGGAPPPPPEIPPPVVMEPAPAPVLLPDGDSAVKPRFVKPAAKPPEKKEGPSALPWIVGGIALLLAGGK